MGKTAKISFVSSLGTAIENLNVPAKRIVCPVCDGEGSELYGGLKSEAFTEEDFKDPGNQDFMRSMARGEFDVACSCCHGKNVVDEPDWELIKDRYPLIYKNYWETIEAERESEMEAYYKSRMGC